jgi:proteasome lid subunit RPN8/RPN11
MADPDDDTPRNVSWEMARIALYPATVKASVKVQTRDDGLFAIEFDLRTDKILDGDPAADIREIETIIFLYPSAELVGRIAPVINSGRGDFPRDLQHLNPRPDELPVSFCLTRTSPQPLYDRSGVTGILIRLSDWLLDAKAGTLNEDGWDPVPPNPAEQSVMGFINAKSLQEYACAHPDGGFGYIAAGVEKGDNGQRFFQAATPIIDTHNDQERDRATANFKTNPHSGGQFETWIPAIFCWPPRDHVEPAPMFHRWKSPDALKTGLEETDLWKHLDTAMIKLPLLFGANGDAPDSDKAGGRAVLLITGLWRPKPIEPTIVGLSEDEEARSLELRAFLLLRPREQKNLFGPETQLLDFHGLTPPTPEVMEIVSGEQALSKPLVIGAGAMGSAILDYATRGGTSEMQVVDNDMFLAHNLARHRGEIFDIIHAKAMVAKRIVEDRAQDVTVTPHPKNLILWDKSELNGAMEASDMVIDATAEPQVRSILSRRGLPDRTLVRTEIFNRGRLGVTLVTRLGAPQSLNMLYHQLVALAQSDEDVKAWLTYEATRKFQDEELLLGFGCRSLTTKMPIYKVDAHAANAYAVLKNRTDDAPLIALHPIDAHGLSQGVKLISPDPVAMFEGDEALNDWRVVMTQSALQNIHDARTAAAPNETGGYLYGAVNLACGEICILFASNEPPNTEASPKHIELGACGQTSAEKVFLRRTLHRLTAIGTWHSHPNGDPEASKTDWDSVETFKAVDAARAIPTIMMITGKARDRVYVVEP